MWLVHVGNGKNGIFYQLYNSSGITLGVNAKANDDFGIANKYTPSVTMDDDGNFVIAWYDNRNGNYDIYFQHFNINGTRQGENTKANDDIGSSDQHDPSITIDDSGNFAIVWVDFRNGNRDIYFQHYNCNEIGQGGNIKVNDDIGTEWQLNPSIAIDGNGNNAIVWEDERNDITEIYYQLFDANGNTKGINKKANDDSEQTTGRYPAIATDVQGNFVIVYESRDYIYNYVYYQQYNNSGISLGVSRKANDISSKFDPNYSSIAMDSSANFVIAWEDFRNGAFGNIYCQSFNNSGIMQGGNTKVNDDDGLAIQHYPKIAMDGSGNYVIAWMDKRNGNYDIYLQRFNKNGTAIGKNTKANDDFGTKNQYIPSIAMDSDGRFVIVWQDERYGINNPDIVAQRFNADGSMNGSNYRIVADGPNYGEVYPVVAANEDKIVFAWQDNRRSKGWDIYGKVVGWDWDGVTSVSENEGNTSKEFELIGNYPNPFYDQTSFEYLLENKSNIDVSVFDIHGSKIRTLQKGSQAAGRHTLTWDGKDNNGNDLNTGVYFIRFSSSKFHSVVKTVLMK